MLRSLKSSAADAVALDRVKEWTRARFRLGEDAAILVAQVSCQLPGCAPLETVVAFWSDEQRYRFKVFKPVEEVLPDDLPPAWFKDALADTGDLGCECC
jgi:hypothetical protein